MPTQDPQPSKAVWINESNSPILVDCPVSGEVEIAPGARSPEFDFLPTNFYSLEMLLRTADGVFASSIQWRTVADSYVLVKRDHDSTDHRVEATVLKQPQTYCFGLRRNNGADGILIVGTIDTK